MEISPPRNVKGICTFLGSEISIFAHVDLRQEKIAEFDDFSDQNGQSGPKSKSSVKHRGFFTKITTVWAFLSAQVVPKRLHFSNLFLSQIDMCPKVPK